MAISVIQHTALLGNANANSLDVTISASAAGSIIVVGGVVSNLAIGFVGFTNVTDDQNNQYQQCTSATAFGGTGNGFSSELWWCPNPVAGVTKVTITWNQAAGTYGKEGWVWEAAGLVTPTYDNGSGTHSSGNTLSASSYVVQQLAPGFAVGVVGAQNQAITQNPKTGNAFTDGGDIVGDSAGCSYLYPIGTSTLQPVWLAASSTNYTAVSAGIFDAGPPPAAAIGAPLTVSLTSQISHTALRM